MQDFNEDYDPTNYGVPKKRWGFEYFIKKYKEETPQIIFYSEKWRWVPLLVLLKWILPRTRWVSIKPNRRNPLGFAFQVDAEYTLWPEVGRPLK
jgi:hypothetical protein